MSTFTFMTVLDACEAAVMPADVVYSFLLLLARVMNMAMSKICGAVLDLRFPQW
jgi:hypothetical protein